MNRRRLLLYRLAQAQQRLTGAAQAYPAPTQTTKTQDKEEAEDGKE